MSDIHATDTTPSPPGPIGSRSDFHAAVHWAVRATVAANARRMWWACADFADWPLDSAELLAQLTAWLRQPQRRLVLLADDYDAVQRSHPRFVAWRRDWVHAVEPFAPPAELAGRFPGLIVDDGSVCLHLIDAAHWRGRVGHDARAAHTWRHEIDVILQRSEASFPAHPLGL
jgi:hypothetical protein